MAIISIATRSRKMQQGIRGSLLLSAPTLKGPREGAIARLMEPLEQQLGGRVVLDANVAST